MTCITCRTEYYIENVNAEFGACEDCERKAKRETFGELQKALGPSVSKKKLENLIAATLHAMFSFEKELRSPRPPAGRSRRTDLGIDPSKHQGYS
jgi:hypothetical protein